MRRLAPVALLVLALAAPATAHAHASLKHVTPATQSRVETPPRTVRLQFDQSVTITPDAIDVFTSDGKKVSGDRVHVHRQQGRDRAGARPEAR